METIKKVKGVAVHCNDGSTFFWTSPYSFKRMVGDNLIDSSLRRSGMSLDEAHAYCDAHKVKQVLSVQ